MNVVLIGFIAIPVVLFAALLLVYRVAEATRVSRAARLAIAIPAGVASITLAIVHAGSGGVFWVPLVTAAIWGWFMVIARREAGA